MQMMDKLNELRAQQAEEKRQKIAALDDGSVKGLLLASEDTKQLGAWTEFNVDKETAELFGKNVLSDENAFNVIAVCRKAFKKEDIVLCNFVNSDECGIAFTEDKIYSFWNSELENTVEYAAIESADFELDTVTVTLTDGNEVDLYCDKEKYTKHLYSLLIDIRDRLNESQTAE